MTSSELPKIAVAEHLAQKICALDVARLPDAVRAKCEDLLVDVVGLAVTARNEDYVKAALAGCDDDGPCTAIGHARTLSRRRRSAGQRHRDPRRRFRRHVRRRPDPCRRGHRAGGAGGLRAAQLGWPRRASRHRRRRRDHVPAQHRGADAHPQSGLSSDRGVRRHGCRGRCRRGAETQRRGNWSMRSAPRPRWQAASSNIWPRAPGPSGCMPAGRRNRASARRCSAAPAFSARARCSKACTASFMVLRTPPRATTTR